MSLAGNSYIPYLVVVAIITGQLQGDCRDVCGQSCRQEANAGSTVSVKCALCQGVTGTYDTIIVETILITVTIGIQVQIPVLAYI